MLEVRKTSNTRGAIGAQNVKSSAIVRVLIAPSVLYVISANVCDFGGNFRPKKGLSCTVVSKQFFSFDFIIDFQVRGY